MAIKNNIHLSRIVYLSVFCFIILFSFSAADNASAALVPCGRTADDPATAINETNPCRLCHLITGIHGIITWGRNILIIVGIAAITIGGVMYIVSAGNEETMETAKNFIKQSLYGVAIVLGAWLIVNTTMWLLATNDDLGIGVAGWDEFNCYPDGIVPPTPTPAPAPTPTPTTPPPAEPIMGTEQEVRDLFASEGISINNLPCEPGQTVGCTDVGGLLSSTINGVIALNDACPECNIIITGGSEGGHAPGDYSHETGYKVDLGLNSTLNNYITTNYDFIGTRSDGARMYEDDGGNIYALESNHWDVCYHCF